MDYANRLATLRLYAPGIRLKISIGLRLFFSVLFAIMAVALSSALLMRQNVMDRMSDYSLSLELDQLTALSQDLRDRYQVAGNWDFVPEDRPSRRLWIVAQLQRLDNIRVKVTLAPGQPHPTEKALIALFKSQVPAAPPRVELNELALAGRVTLLDASANYVAGKPPSAFDHSARRSMTVGGGIAGYLVVTKGAGPHDGMAAAFLQQMQQTLWIIAGTSLVLSALAAWLLALHFRKPIKLLAQGAQQLAGGDYETRLDTSRSDEIGDLARNFNLLAARLDQVDASRRQWVADTSHELRTPLAVLRAQLEALQDGVRTPSEQHTASMLAQVLSLNKLIDELYALARADIGELDCDSEKIDVAFLVHEHMRAFAARFEDALIALDPVSPPGPCYAMADSERLRQVLTNIYENCIRYCGPGTRVKVSVGRTPVGVEVVVDDSGPGVPDAALDRLAERFYRVDSSRSRSHGGAGLGLSLSQRIMKVHGGQLEFDHSPLGGLQVRATLVAA